MRVLALALLVALVSACNEGSAAIPNFDSFEGGGVDSAVAADATAEASYAVCPPDVDATFGSLYTQIFSTSSCGTNNPLGCHSASGSVTAGNLLDFSLDAGEKAVYAELLGADGGGRLATNEDGTAKVLRVQAFDAGASMLYIKLTIGSTTSPLYGEGMPLGTPGSICPASLDAVAAWINSGATFEPAAADGGTAEGGSDAGGPSDAALD